MNFGQSAAAMRVDQDLRRYQKRCREPPENSAVANSKTLLNSSDGQTARVAVSLSCPASCCVWRESAHDTTAQGEPVEIIVAAAITAAGTVVAAWIGRRGQGKRNTAADSGSRTDMRSDSVRAPEARHRPRDW